MNSSPDPLAASIEAIIFDVDGVMTDGGLYYGPDGEWKRFDVQDGHAVVMARKAGIRLAFLTGRTSEAVTRRARELGIDILRDGVYDKGAVFGEITSELKVNPDEVCYVGDDVVDLPAMARAGFPVAVANAVPEVQAAAAWTTPRAGGRGAVRDVVERILKAKGLWLT